MAAINPQKIVGKWHAGVALDFHTLSSIPNGQDDYGHPKFETLRPELGQLLYRLKYHNDRSAAPEIILTAATFIKSKKTKFDFITHSIAHIVL